MKLTLSVLVPLLILLPSLAVAEDELTTAVLSTW
jgi:hypothetical protein